MMLFQVTYTMLPGQRDAFLQMMRESGILDQIRREESGLPLLPPGGGGRHPAAGGAVDRAGGTEGPHGHRTHGPAGPGQGPVCGGDQHSLLGAGLSFYADIL